MKKYFIIFSLLIFCCFNALAQSFTISGLVKDDREPIPGAAVYLSGTKISTISNNDGKFSIGNLPAGSYDILVQVVGYIPYNKSIVITNQSINLAISLVANPVSLHEVVIKPDPNRLNYINIFKDFFIGTTPNAQTCKILNPEVLSVAYDKQQKLLTVSSNEFLIIENKALGYRIKYLLKTFEYDYKTRIMFFAGFPFFEEMKGSKSKMKRWNEKRHLAYYGSYQHFFKSLYAGNILTEGFKLHKLITVPNKNRLPDSVINRNIKRLSTGANAINVITFRENDSLNYWLKERKKPLNMAVLNKADVNIDTLVKMYNTDSKLLNFVDELFVIYIKEKESELYTNSAFYIDRPLTMSNHQVSLVNLVEPLIIFYKNGSILNPRSFILKGFWAYEKMADAVPIEFEPQR